MPRGIFGGVTGSLFRAARASNKVNQASKGPSAYGGYLIRKSLLKGIYTAMRGGR